MLMGDTIRIPGVLKIQLNFDERGQKLIPKLMRWTGATTYKDMFNNALTLLDWAIDQRAKGRIVASMDETNETYKELVMPALQHAADLGTEQQYSADWPAKSEAQTVQATPATAQRG